MTEVAKKILYFDTDKDQKQLIQANSKNSMLPPIMPTRILIVEDDEDDYLIIDACIKDIPDKEFRIDWCYNYEDALQRIRESQYDLYFVDYLLGKERVWNCCGRRSPGAVRIRSCCSPASATGMSMYRP
jgi:hypothetical protein